MQVSKYKHLSLNKLAKMNNTNKLSIKMYIQQFVHLPKHWTKYVMKNNSTTYN